jgi:hypothetical protein
MSHRSFLSSLSHFFLSDPGDATEGVAHAKPLLYNTDTYLMAACFLNHGTVTESKEG